MTDNVTTEVTTQDLKRGPRGNVGEATPSLSVKKAWKLAPTKMSLKAWAKKNMLEQYVMWMANKHGALDKPRLDKNIAMAKLLAAATKQSRKKTKN